VWVQGCEYYALSQEGILYVFGQACGTTGHKVDFLLYVLVLEKAVLVGLLGVENPVAHLVVDGQEEEEEDHNMGVADGLFLQFLVELIQAEDGGFEATVVDFGVVYHFSHQHRHKTRVL